MIVNTKLVIFTTEFVVASDYLATMDDKWFKQQQKIAGVTADDIAARLGKDRSLVSRIYVGRQKMTFEQAKVFAEVLGTPLDEVLKRAGLADEPVARTIRPGFSESDAVAWIPQGFNDQQIPTMAAALGTRPGIDIWQIRSGAMALMGYLPGDFMLVDTHASERARAGDIVVAQIYDNAKGSASTVLRRFEPPVLVAASTDIDDRRVHVVDGVNVVILGRVTAAWRVNS